ncbi:phosphatase PAP2 family protein [Niastella caeni]|uniref:Phosphatase PAP2 family protein n=1 Tax=Niastella caeni TaxID=2569763 RepID=A0A4S8HIS1_9BACT|nr:vanadium-dependent haloperoxidase [Niastella caeni]THU34953.1 phosphatase PAP2 family protein [Niastella caeni]
MNRLTKWIITGLFFSFIALSCKKNIPSDHINWKNLLGSRSFNDVLSNSEVIKWNNVAFEAAGGAAEANPLLAVRSEAMVHIAIHDALNAIVPVYEHYIFHGVNPLADPFAAVASAAHTVLMASWPDSAAMLDAKLAESLSKIASGHAKTWGIAIGMESAKAILALRAGDGAFQNPVSPVPPSTVPGVYVAVPPFDFQFGVFWKTMQLFSLETHDQFRSSSPPSLTSGTYTRDFNEVKEVGELNSTVRTADQSAYSAWWFEYSDIGWNRVARVSATTQNPGLYTTARMFALLNMALADGYTAFLEAKYFYNFWRPYTAIRAAATDGNDKTTPDADWEPLLPTPPVPDYPSGHCVLGNAAATVLTHFFGNHSPFSMTSTTASPAGAVRHFDSFKEAADENADSRVMVGIHFRFACVAGQKMGDQIGKWTVKHHLEPLH